MSSIRITTTLGRSAAAAFATRAKISAVALTRAKVPAEMYLFEHGSHGMGMKAEFGTASDWPARAAEWLRNRGLLTAIKQ